MGVGLLISLKSLVSKIHDAYCSDKRFCRAVFKEGVELNMAKRMLIFLILLLTRDAFACMAAERVHPEKKELYQS